MLYNVKAGIIGLNDLGRNYAGLLKNHIKDLNLIGACGRTQKELLFAKNDLSLEYVYSDEKSLIENHDIDAIFIFSDPKQRPHLTIQSIEAGKHTFIADPISLNVEDAIAVQNCAESHPSQRVMISSFVRFNPLLKAVKKVIEKGEIGVINHINLDTAFFNGLNRRFNTTTGSVFLDTALDEIDVCLWLMNDKFLNVNVVTHKNTIVCTANSENDSSINIILQPELKKEQSYLNIYGNKGQILLSNTNHRSFKLYKDNGEKIDVYREDDNGFLFPEYLQLHQFTQAILGKQKATVSTRESVDNLKVALSFEKSKVLGKPFAI